MVSHRFPLADAAVAVQTSLGPHIPTTVLTSDTLAWRASSRYCPSYVG